MDHKTEEFITIHKTTKPRGDMKMKKRMCQH